MIAAMGALARLGAEPGFAGELSGQKAAGLSAKSLGVGMPEKTKRVTDLSLEKIPLFRAVSPESLQGIMDRCRSRELQKEETLLLPDRENRELYILLSGGLRIHLQDLDSEPVALIEPGEVVGELSVIDGSRTSAFVVADQASRVLVMEQELVWSLISVSHAAACNLLTMLAGRLRKADRCIAEKMLREHSFHSYGTVDALTGMHNRHWLNQSLARMAHRSSRGGTPFSVLMVDIDCFKNFNDTYGHLCGDRAIHTVARTLLQNLRPTVLAARYGGDEFVIALPDMAAVKARQVAERLLQKVRNKEITLDGRGSVPPVTVSIGVAQFHSGQTADDLIAAADAALYRAKEQGRNKVSE